MSFTLSKQAAEGAFLASFAPCDATLDASRLQLECGWDSSECRGSHFRIWAPLTWIVDRLKATVVGAFSAIFGPLMSHPVTPVCDVTSDNFLINDSKLNGAIEVCAEMADLHSTRIKITNTRAYPVDLLTPASATVSVGESDDNVAARLGALFTKLVTARSGVKQTLLPPRASAVITLPLAPGASSSIETRIDALAWGVATLATALQELGFVYGHLASKIFGHPDPAFTTTLIARVLDAVEVGSCLAQVITLLGRPDPLSLAAARAVGLAGFNCLAATVKNVAEIVAAAAFQVIIGLGDALVQAAYGAVDSAMGQSAHTIGIRRIGVVGTGSAGQPTGPETGATERLLDREPVPLRWRQPASRVYQRCKCGGDHPLRFAATGPTGFRCGEPSRGSRHQLAVPAGGCSFHLERHGNHGIRRQYQFRHQWSSGTRTSTACAGSPATCAGSPAIGTCHHVLLPE